MNFTNNTPHNAAPFFLMDQSGADTLLIVVKATWTIGKDGKLTVRDEQMPIISEPVYYGEPGKSSLRYDTDIVLKKPGTDCVLIGHAWAAPGTRTQYTDVTFSVGPVTKQARVFWERRWVRNKIGMASISWVAWLEKIPLTWEHAFGGADTSWKDPSAHEFCLENPVGRGMMAAKSNIKIDILPLPNIENPANLIKKPGQCPEPTGFGMIAPYWQPRAGYAGTSDDSWKENICPLPPADLDPRFYSCAASGLRTQKHLTGVEPVSVEGASKQGPLRFDLPGVKPWTSVCCRQSEEVIPLLLDTVIVEPDEARLVLVWRGSMNVHARVHELGAVRVGL